MSLYRPILLSMLVGSGLECSNPQPGSTSSALPTAPPSSSSSPATDPPTVEDLPSVPLVLVDGRGTYEIRPLSVTLFVTPHEVIVQRGASASILPSEVIGRYNPATASEHLIARMTERLAEVLAESERGDDLRSRTALVVLTPDVTMGTLIDVLYSSGRAGMFGYELAVDTEAGPRALSLLPPRTCAEPGAGGDLCVRPQILFADDGMLLSAQRVDEGTTCESDRPASEPPRSGRNIWGPDGACPTAWDSEQSAIPWFLGELPRLGRVCRHALVSAELGVPWSRLAPAFALLHAELVYGLVIEASAPTGCLDPVDLRDPDREPA